METNLEFIKLYESLSKLNEDTNEHVSSPIINKLISLAIQALKRGVGDRDKLNKFIMQARREKISNISVDEILDDDNNKIFRINYKYDQDTFLDLPVSNSEQAPDNSKIQLQEARLIAANSFLRAFNTYAKDSIVYYGDNYFRYDPDKAYDADTIKNLSFYLPSLKTYYEDAEPKDKDNLRITLKAYFNCGIGSSESDNSLTYRSLQYLYNAMVQEQTIEDIPNM